MHFIVELKVQAEHTLISHERWESRDAATVRGMWEGGGAKRVVNRSIFLRRLDRLEGSVRKCWQSVGVKHKASYEFVFLLDCSEELTKANHLSRITLYSALRCVCVCVYVWGNDQLNGKLMDLVLVWTLCNYEKEQEHDDVNEEGIKI